MCSAARLTVVISWKGLKIPFALWPPNTRLICIIPQNWCEDNLKCTLNIELGEMNFKKRISPSGVSAEWSSLFHRGAGHYHIYHLGRDNIKRKGFHWSLGQEGAARKTACAVATFQKTQPSNSHVTAWGDWRQRERYFSSAYYPTMLYEVSTVF